MSKSMLILVLCLAVVIAPGVIFAQSQSEPEVTPEQQIGQNEDMKFPQLTSEEKDLLNKIVFSDKDVIDIVGNRDYTTIYTDVWLQGNQFEKIGGYIQIAFEEPIVQEREWPRVEYYDKENEEREYTDSELATFAKGEYLQYRKWEKAEFRQLNIRVDFRTERVVNIISLPLPPLPQDIREAQASLTPGVPPCYKEISSRE